MALDIPSTADATAVSSEPLNAPPDGTVTPDSVYQLIKSYEGQFTPPAPYVTVDVGTFDADTGSFTGLTSSSETDPEPLPHGPHDTPRNRPGRFVGTEWVAVTIDATWHATTTRIPAPIVPLAPVLLRFAVTHPVPGGWSVNVRGIAAAADSASTEILVDIWDAADAAWTLTAGQFAASDRLMVQRPSGVLGVGLGAFTVPVLPVCIVYAPPVDSAGKSVASYADGQTVGASTSFEDSTDTSTTVPVRSTSFAGIGGLVSDLTVMSKIPGIGTTGSVLATAADQLGKVSATLTSGTISDYQSQLTVTTTTTDTILTSTASGGPGVGDVLHYLHNILFAWAYYNGQLRLCPFAWNNATFPVGILLNDPGSVGLADEDAQSLLALDPFVHSGTGSVLPTDRFTQLGTYEYGFGAEQALTQTVTRDTKITTTDTSYTTSTDKWDAGPILTGLLLGQQNTTTIKVANAQGEEVSTTVTITATLASGPDERFVVCLWYDQLFGTYAFQPLQASTPRLTGEGTSPGASVILQIDGQTFTTIADDQGRYAYYAPNIPSGLAQVTVNGAAQAVLVGAGLPHLPRQIPGPRPAGVRA